MTNKLRLISIIGVFAFFMFSIVFLRWYDINSFFLRKVVQLVILVVFYGFMFISKTKDTKLGKKINIMFLIFLIYIALNVIVLGKKAYFEKEFSLYTILPALSFLSLVFISINIKLKENLIKYITPLFNIYYVINTIIMILQIKIPFFMMRHIPEGRMMYEDQIDGLFGMNATHLLSFFYIIVILLNYIVYKKNNNKKYLFFMIFIIASSIIISFFNDNKSYFALFIIVLFMIVINSIKSFKLRKNYVLFIILILSGCFFTHLFFTYIDTNSKMSLSYNSYLTLLLHSEESERNTLTKYAMINGNGNRFGMGIGSILDYGDPTMPLHFGINNMSSLIYQGGIIYLILNIVLYYIISLRMFINPSLKNKISILILLIFVAYYTQPFSENLLSYLLGIVMIEFAYIVEIYKNSKEE